MNGVLGTWIDGVPGEHIPVADRGLQYGDGLFETVLVRERRARFLELHLARLARGCERLQLHFGAVDALRADLDLAVSRAPALAILKIIVTRGSARRRGYAPEGGESARRIVSLMECEAPASLPQGVDLHPASVAAAENPALAGLKHLNRLENVLAAREAREAGAFDALIMGVDGRIVSGAMTNVFVVRDGALLTPSLAGAGVAGIMRTVVLREAPSLGLAVTEARLGRSELLAADEAFVTNARIGVVPVRRVGEHAFRMNGIGLRIARHVETLDA